MIFKTMKSFTKRLIESKSCMIASFILLLVAFSAVFSPLIAPYPPEKASIMDSREGPSFSHPFGTDGMGRDILSRIIYGSRLTLLVGFTAVALGALIGVPLGLISGFYGGVLDSLIRSLADLMLSFPSFLLALSLVAVLGVGLRNVIVAVGVSTIPIFIRLVRGEVFSLREEEYVMSAKALGRSGVKILIHHVLRNVFPLILIQSSIYMGMSLLYAAGLGFLGLGVQPPTPEWGTMLGEARTYIFSSPYISVSPGMAIFLTVLSLNLLGDGLRDILDPHLN